MYDREEAEKKWYRHIAKLNKKRPDLYDLSTLFPHILINASFVNAIWSKMNIKIIY